MDDATKCEAMDCNRPVGSGFPMCRRHWSMVEKSLQEEIWEARHARDTGAHMMLVARAKERVRVREIEIGRRCRCCDAPIFFAISAATQRPIPIDSQPDANGDVLIRQGRRSTRLYASLVPAGSHHDEDRYTVHFATCQQERVWWRDKRKAEKAESKRKAKATRRDAD